MVVVALLHWLAGSVASQDGTPSIARIMGVITTLVLCTLALWQPVQTGALAILAAFAATCLGLRDGGPLDSYLAQRAAIAAGAPPPPPPAGS